jgi:hypothetical protein
MRVINLLFVLTLFSWAWTQTGTLEASDPQLASGEYYDLYTHIAGTANGVLTIDLRSSDFDVYVIVLDPNGNPLAEFDDTTGLGTDLRETLTLPAAGTYTVAVTSAFAGELGRYTLQLSEAPALSKGKGTVPGTPVPTPPAVSPLPPTPTTSPATVGFVTGRVVGANGQPIAAPSAVVTVSISGVSYQSGQNVAFTATPNPDGSYAQRVADGSYRVSASVALTYDGQEYRLDLEPVGGSQANRDSAAGIQQDFVWRIQGLRPGRATGTRDSSDYYGVTIAPHFQSTFSDRQSRWIPIGPLDARVIFTLTPTAPLLDGSRGETLTLEGNYSDLYNDFNGSLYDVPIGVYEAAGVEVGADGRVTPLLLWESATSTYVERVPVRFRASYGGAWPPSLWFTRPE